MDKLENRNTLTVDTARKKMLDAFLYPLDSILSKDDVTNILISSWDKIYYDDSNGRHLYPDSIFKSENDLKQLLSQLATEQLDIPFSERSPVFHGSLPDGSRIYASMPPVAPDGVTAFIRLFPKVRFSLDDLMSFGMFPESQLSVLIDIIKSGSNFILSGSTNAGKTSFLNAMLQYLDNNLDHVLVVQDVMELALPDVFLTNLLEMHHLTRIDGRTCTLDTLIEDSLRATPDRIIVGEIRNPFAALAFYDALNTGHTGVSATLHANSPYSAIDRLSRFVVPQTKMPFEVVRENLYESIGYSINVGFDTPAQLSLSGERKRRLQQIVQFDGSGNDEVIYQYQPEAN